MTFLKRLFGPAQKAAPLFVPPVTTVTSRPEAALTIDSSSRHFIHIAELDFFGQWSRSSDGRFMLTWRDGNDEQTQGGHRASGPGLVLLLENDRLIAKVRAERPNNGRVANDGTFIVNDWGFGDGLKGTFLAFSRDGAGIVADELAANLLNNGISDDGRLAVCQTANAPGDDGSKLFIYDLVRSQRLARLSPEQGWASDYVFDPEGRFVACHYDDGSTVRYDLGGQMLDREEWRHGRIARGDVRVIASTLKERGGALDGDEAQSLLAGLDTAIASDELLLRARAYRFKGEIFEQVGRDAEALVAYGHALTLDPQVGALRRADKLRAKLTPRAATDAAPKKLSRFERQAERLSIEHERIDLHLGEPKQWRFDPTLPFSLVERAALCHYEAQGWTGAAAEGGLMLTLLKAASFAPLAPRNADTFVEALYAQNVAFEEDRFGSAAMIATIKRATLRQIERNWQIISATAGDTPAFYPRVRWPHVSGLFEALGTERLAAIAEVFATAPYDLRAGWPDLTLWRAREVRFIEVKAPGDQLHASQSRLMSTLLVPLGFRTGLAQIVAKP